LHVPELHETELSDLDKQIELKKQELAALKAQEDGKTERFVMGGLLACIGVLCAGVAAAEASKAKKKKGWF